MRYLTSASKLADGQVDYIRSINSPMFDYLEILFNHTYDFPKYGMSKSFKLINLINMPVLYYPFNNMARFKELL